MAEADLNLSAGIIREDVFLDSIFAVVESRARCPHADCLQFSLGTVYNAVTEGPPKYIAPPTPPPPQPPPPPPPLPPPPAPPASAPPKPKRVYKKLKDIPDDTDLFDVQPHRCKNSDQVR
jgi:hypothetical protein